MKRSKLSTSVKTSVKVSQRITVVKYVVAGTFIFGIAGLAIFLYLNLANSENAAAGNRKGGEMEEVEQTTAYQNAPVNSPVTAIDLSAYLSTDELELLTNRDFVRDTTRKEYTSVKWNVNSSYSHLTLEVTNNKSTYSLEVFDQNGARVLYFANITDEKFFVDKLDLIPNLEYNYVVKNSAGELYAGNIRF